MSNTYRWRPWGERKSLRDFHCRVAAATEARFPLCWLVIHSAPRLASHVEELWPSPCGSSTSARRCVCSAPNRKNAHFFAQSLHSVDPWQNADAPTLHSMTRGQPPPTSSPRGCASQRALFLARHRSLTLLAIQGGRLADVALVPRLLVVNIEGLLIGRLCSAAAPP